MVLKKILYAEDEKDVQLTVQIALWAYRNMYVKFCDNGQQLLDCVEYYKPDLILLDVLMPVMDGMTAFRQLKLNENTKDIPVVFITTEGQLQELEMYKSIGIIGVIVKPFEPTNLANKIYELWDFYQNKEKDSQEVLVL